MNYVACLNCGFQWRIVLLVCLCVCVLCIFPVKLAAVCVSYFLSLQQFVSLPRIFAFHPFHVHWHNPEWVRFIRNSLVRLITLNRLPFIWHSFILNIWIWYLVSICPCAFEGSWRETKVTVFSFWDALLSLYPFLWLCVFIKALKTF